MTPPTELAWAAGFFEGEGTVTAKRQRGKVYPRLAVTQNGGPEAVAVLQRFVDAVGHGAVLGPYDYVGRYARSSLGKKPRHVVAVQSTAGVFDVMQKLAPYFSPLSPKAEKFAAIIAERKEAGQ